MSRAANSAVVLGASTGTGAAITKCGPWSRVVGFHRGRHMREAAEIIRTHPYVQLHNQDAGSCYAAVQTGVNIAANALPARSVNTFVHALSGAAVCATFDTGPLEVERTFAVMAHSFLWWAQGLHLRGLLAPSATLIALSNPVAENYLRNSGVIGPAKAALEAYVKDLAVEMGRGGRRVMAIRFGAIATPALERVVPATAAALEKLHERISPAGRMQTADEIAAFVALLADRSEATAALNGAIIDFTFGAHLTLLDAAFSGR